MSYAFWEEPFTDSELVQERSVPLRASRLGFDLTTLSSRLVVVVDVFLAWVLFFCWPVCHAYLFREGRCE